MFMTFPSRTPGCNRFPHRVIGFAVATTTLAFAVLSPLKAASLRYAGVFGNSGEEGETLVRFAPEPRPGMRVVCDSHGTLWDRAGDGVLNRYSPDGRLLATYPFPKEPSGHRGDRLVADDDTFLFLCNKRLYIHRPDDAPDAIPAPLEGITADFLSANLHEGFAAAINKEEIFLINAGGETRHIATPPEDEPCYGISIGPGGEVYFIGAGRRMTRVDPAAPENGRGPFESPGSPIQWIDGYWYGGGGHGTLFRFSSDFRSDPGVVLGGNSGSFIGYVPGNYEISDPRGLTRLEGDIYAVSGIEGIIHLLQWNPADKRFEIIRRIGAVQRCSALTLDNEYRLWWESGIWEWNDQPDTPIRHGVPTPDKRRFAGSALLQSGKMVSPAVQHGKPTLYVGTLEGPVRRYGFSGDLPEEATLTAVVNKERELLVINREGNGSRFALKGDGAPDRLLGPVTLRTGAPVKEWTSLFAVGEGLIGTADGAVIELAPAENGWEEVQRWNTWGKTEAERFGERICATAGEGRLWVSDTLRHRVICFDLQERKPLATFGNRDHPGDDTASLNEPGIITANRLRAVVYDSANQRLLKLELIP